MAFYSPLYSDQETMEAISENRRNATFLDVSAETLVDGKPAAVQFISYHKKKA